MNLEVSFYESESCSVVSNSLWSHGLYSSWKSPGQNTGVGSHSLLQEIFPTPYQTQVSHIAGKFFTSWANREAQKRGHCGCMGQEDVILNEIVRHWTKNIVWSPLYMESKPNRQIKIQTIIEKRNQICGYGVWMRGSWWKVVKRYKLAVKR